jgi:transcriptional regulator with XRE-family HTH domain
LSDAMFIANRIKALMDERCLSQQGLATRSGTTPATICRYVNGVHTPTIDILKSIGDALNVSIDYLVGASNIPERRTAKDELYYRFFSCFAKATSKEQALILSTVAEYANAVERPFIDELILKI